MNPVVAFVSQGFMGAGLARRLTESGAVVRTSLAGRSASSIARARAAGMLDASPDELCASDFFLSVVPPSAALDVARWFGALARGRARKPSYVDCNAICPATVIDVARVIEAAGAEFTDGSIIGGPPKPGGPGPAIYVSGPHAPRIEALRSVGLDIRLLGSALGEASALKMSYAGITKGLNVLAVSMIRAAAEAGSAEILRRELEASQPELLAWFKRYLPGVFGKAYRWVGEMEEIAAFAGKDKAAADLYLAAAAVFEGLEGERAERSAKVIEAFLA